MTKKPTDKKLPTPKMDPADACCTIALETGEVCEHCPNGRRGVVEVEPGRYINAH